MMNSCIYLDNAATTRVDPRVLEAMLPYFSEHYGNASSLHSFGTVAKDAILHARKTIAATLHTDPSELIFTSSGTEANNFVIKGIAFANRHKGNHLIISSIEHDCILNAAQWLETQGFVVTLLPVDPLGNVDPESVRQAITDHTILVSVMHANNEIGTLEPIEQIGRICHENGILFHTDACQTYGKIPIDVRLLPVDLITLNAHKIYGPQGIGALYCRKGIQITPLLHGGGQESGFRSSTENVASIVGFAKAAEICAERMEEESALIRKLRNRIISKLSEEVEEIYFNGDPDNSMPNLINFCISGLEGEAIRLLLLLDEEGIAVSTGSACSSNNGGNPSHVLQAIGLNPFQARGAIRLSLGRFNTEAEIDRFLNIFLSKLTNLNSIFS